MSKQPFKARLEEPIESFDTVGKQLSWPSPVSHRVDQLVDRARRARTDRSEVVAAILCAQDYTPEELEQMILDYRAMRVRDVVLEVEPGATIIELPKHSAGRRTRRA